MTATRTTPATRTAPATRGTAAPGTTRPVDLPTVALSPELPAAVYVALPVRPGEPGPVLVGSAPAQAAHLDLAGLLALEKANGAAGELIAVPLLASADVGQDPGASGRSPVVEGDAGSGGGWLLLVGVGEGGPVQLRKVGAALARRTRRSASLAVDLRALDLAPLGLRALVDGLLLASYGFTMREGAEPRELRDITVVLPPGPGLQNALDAAVATSRATAAARDLVNTPSLVKTPAWLATEASRLLVGLDVRVRDDQELLAEGFGGLVGVGMGSTRPPRLIEATWDPGSTARHVVLVGKGITFDTGGLSLKTNEGMQTMKDDMGGGAAVLGVLRAVADLALPIKVTGLVAAAENMPSGTAQRPGDVLTQYGGRTVEVLNTDAEGRLVLADALAYTDLVLQPDVIVDVATLTGAMPVALGKRIAGLFASDDELAEALGRAGEASGERVWRLPLVQDYRATLESPTADLRNIGNPKAKLQGGSITAALFLREFTGGRPWAHLDIAGPAWSGGDEDELTKGGTGFGVRLLVQWLQDLAATPVRRPRRPATARR